MDMGLPFEHGGLWAIVGMVTFTIYMGIGIFSVTRSVYAAFFLAAAYMGIYAEIVHIAIALDIIRVLATK